MSANFENTINTLCTQLLASKDPATVQRLANELQAAIHSHIEDLRQSLLKVPAVPVSFHPKWQE